MCYSEPKKGMTSDTTSTDFVFPLKAGDPKANKIRQAIAGMINGTYTGSMYVPTHPWHTVVLW